MTKCRLEEVFEKQTRLIEKFHPIEDRNAQLEVAKLPVDINDRYGQARIRNVAWRLTEELCETHQALTHKKPEEVLEEVSDSFHFLIELYITMGMGAHWWSGNMEMDRLEYAFFKVKRDLTYTFNPMEPSEVMMGLISQLGATISNYLKNKPWKQTEKNVIEPDTFYIEMASVMDYFVELVVACGFDDKDLYNAYMGKNAENHKRLESGA